MGNASSQDRFFLEKSNAPKTVFASPFISSFIGHSRKGDLFDSNFAARSASWCNWFVSSLYSFKGLGDREYIGVALPAKFYDSTAHSKPVPHLEIPGKVLLTPTSFFPSNLGLLGNATLSPSWIFSEVVALRKAVFTDITDVSAFAHQLSGYRSGLVTLLTSLNAELKSSWGFFESLIMSKPGVVSDIILQGFDPTHTFKVLRDFPFNVTITPEPSFAASQASWISRRVGIWRVSFTSKAARSGGMNLDPVYSFGVTSPRITFNSLFNDPLFYPSSDSVASLLVRVLLLSALLDLVNISGFTPLKVSATDNMDVLKFKPILARPNARSPQASVKAAVAFVQFFSNPDSAWAGLSSWAGDKYVLTISRKAFVSSFYSVKRSIARLEEPSRTDIDNILPLCWSGENVYRVSFVHS